MNCQEFWSHLPQRGGELPAELTAHLAECAGCASQWGPHRSLALGLQALAVEWRQEEAPERVEAGLRAAFRMQTVHRPRQIRKPAWVAPVLAWAGAAAAMIGLAVLLLHGWQRGPLPPTVATPQGNNPSAPEVAYYQGSETLGSDADDTSSELGEGFVRLPNAPRIEPNEDINVVRFEVPGSTMIAWGLAVSEERASETVVADVALGPEGMARAVRLVSDGGSFEE